MKKIITVLAIILLGTISIYFLGRGNSNRTQTTLSKVKVTTSFYPLYYFTSQIGGDKIDIVNITPAGAEPHDYDPSTKDIAKIEKSDLLVLNGGVEGWGDKIQNNLKGSKTEIVVAGKNLLTQSLVEEGKTQTDPHVWLDPVRAKEEIHEITQALITVDPKDSLYFKANEEKLHKQLDDLDKSFKSGLLNCSHKDIVTSHAAFGYLASRYGLTQVPIAGLSPDQEPSSKQLAEVSDFAKRNNIKYIFFESLVSPKLSETIAREVGAKTLVLDPIEGVSDDDLKSGKNYYNIMQDNLKNLQIALECKT